MANITIKDLRTDRALDRQAMSAIKGGGAPWVFGWMRPFTPGDLNGGSIINFFQINNTYVADQMINQVQNVSIDNSAANATISVALGESSSNRK